MKTHQKTVLELMQMAWFNIDYNISARISAI